MNTLMSVTFYNTKSSVCDRAEDIIESTVKETENIFSATDEKAEVYGFNNRNSESFNCSPDFCNALIKAKQGYDITNGAYDITIMPVLEEWGFSDGGYRVPSEKEIKAALKNTGFSRLNMTGSTVTADTCVKINLGGIAKGYLGDVLIKKLKSENINAVISLGGNIVTIGTRPDKEPWNVAIKNPNTENDIFCTVKVESETSVVTSGGYERYFEFKDKTYHHIIDPKTGYPSESDILSVTVIGKDGALCDALSTGLFVLGTEKAVKTMNSRNDLDYVILTKDSRVYTSLKTEKIALTEESGCTLVTQ